MSHPHRPPKLLYARLLLCVAMLLALLPLPASASIGEPRPPTVPVQAAGVQSPNACAGSPSGLPSSIERTDFCVYYDGGTTLATATAVANWTQNYWNQYVALGFQVPLHSGKLAVDILNNAGCNGGTASGTNDFYIYNGCLGSTEGIMQVVGHELFHRVQLAYGDDYNAGFWLLEGTARHSEDNTFATLDNWAGAMAAPFSFNKQANIYLANTNVDITSDPQRYNSALWWKYFSERYGSNTNEPERGVDALVTLWNATVGADSVAAVNSALGTLGTGTNFDAAFRRFTAANWVKDLTSQPDASFNYIDEEQVGNPAPYGPIVPIPGGTISVGTSAVWSNQGLSRYGAAYYTATPGSPCPMVNTTVHSDFGPAFYHLIAEKAGAVANYGGSTASDWSRSFFNDGLSRLTVVAGATNAAAQANVTIQCVNPTLDIKMPSSGAPARVGAFDGPGKFLAQVQVSNGAGGPAVAGLTVNDFKARVNGQNALITGGGFVQEQYWLVVQAPNQVANGDYDLEIRLEASGTATTIATDTNATSVRYTPDHVDQVLVIDRSGSMSADGKMVAAQNAAKFYVDITRNNDGLAVAPFNHDINPAAFAMQTVNVLVRNDARTYINALTAGGATSIGDGLQEAVNQRDSSPTGNPLCSFVLLSDGMENFPAFWADVQGAVQKTNCPVTTIAFGQASDETLMQNIATATGGLAFFNDVYTSALAANADAMSATSLNTEIELGNSYEYAQAKGEGRQRLLAQRGVMPAATPNTPAPQVLPDEVHTVLVDDSVQEALFALKWELGDCREFCAGLELRLKSPDGKEYSSKELPYDFQDMQSGHLGWRIAKPTPGKWELLVNHAEKANPYQPVPYTVIVSAHTNLSVELLLPDRLGTRYYTGQRIPLYAFVSGEKPLADANVLAIVSAPDGSETAVPLLDDGQHDDGVAGDGFYAGIYDRVNQASAVEPGNEEGEKQDKAKDEAAYRIRLVAQADAFQREALGSFAVQEGPDDNQNGLPDTFEKEKELSGGDAGDPDLDGLDNLSEYLIGTDPNNSDTDNGGENDGSEYEKQQNPFVAKDDQIGALQFLEVQPLNDANQLSYDVQPDYSSLILYRSEQAQGPWSLYEPELAPSGIYSDTQAKNGVAYFYRLLAVDAENHRSAVIASVPATPSQDPFLPEAALLINNGAASTNSRQVQLSFVPGEDRSRFDDIVAVKLSNDPLALINSEWQTFTQPITQSVSWELPETANGDFAHVYPRFRDQAGNQSLVATAMIRFGEQGSVVIDPKLATEQLNDLPLALHRRAEQFVEEMRGNPMAPGWEEARINPLVRQLYRPDLEGVAYYEFQVLNSQGEPSGFFVLTHGEHDYPLSHWNYEGLPPSFVAAQKAATGGKVASKFYKLDTLSYAAEDAEGNQVAEPETALVKLSGLDPKALEQKPELSGDAYQPAGSSQDDQDAPQEAGKSEHSGPSAPDGLKLESWESWSALKAGYKESYGVLLESLRRDAASDWETDKFANENGEGLQKGQVYQLSLLYPEVPSVKLSGDGADEKFLKHEVIQRAGLPAVLRLEVIEASRGQELPLTVEIDYGSVQQAVGQARQAQPETIKFALLELIGELGSNPEITTTAHIYLPAVMSSENNSVQSAAANQVQSGWGPWSFYWAGSHADQRLYSQMAAGAAPNSSGCWSGCGGTAWAMLFGWADNQAASGNGYWAPRWGLYRENGGYGANAVAPATLTSGVRNMSWELRNRAGTFCAAGNGATAPWDMSGASGYLAGRTGTRLNTHYNVLGIHESRLREYARDSIRDRATPAIIGTGWLTHYPLAYGYAWQQRTVRKCFIFCWEEVEYNRWFYVNQGWGSSGNGWVSAGTWFAGEIFPVGELRLKIED